MRAFAIFSVLATLAFSAIASPTPVAEANGVEVVARAKPSSVPQILAAVTSQLQPQMKALTSMTSKTATTDAITSQLLDMNNVLTGGLDSALLLVGEPLDIILLDVDEVTVLTVSEVSTIVASLTSDVVVTLTGLLNTVDLDIDFLGSELGIVGITLADLINELTFLIDGLLFDLTPLVNGLLFDIDQLLFGTLAVVLGLL